MSKLKISDDVSLPIEAVTQTFAILAVRGVGKTHTASVMAEEMLKRRQPICVYDPTGAWWGLKASADGKSPGFPVYVFGGEHADVPLEETAGETIATAIVEQRIPAILDVSLLRKGARTRFMTDFLETLYHKNREPLHLFADEAHTLAPLQTNKQPDIARCLGAMEDIILQGRRRGLGVTVISQRPALLNTNIRSLCEVLIAMRIIGPHDRKAVMEWIEAHGTPEQAKELLASLPHLAIGEGWVWSPGWLDLFVRTKFRRRETFDSSATPKAGERPVTPKELAAIDVEKLGNAIRKTVEDKKANDPSNLKREIADLRKQLAAAPAKAEVKTVEKPVVTDKQVKEVEDIVTRLEKEGKRRIEAAEAWMESGRQLVETGRKFAEALRAAGSQPAARTAFVARPVATARLVVPSRAPHAAGVTADGVSPAQQKILNSLAWWSVIGVDVVEKQCAAVMAGYTVNGHFNNVVGSLRTAGLIDYPTGGAVSLTDAGRQAATFPESPGTLEDVHRAWREKLSPAQWKIVEAVMAAHPREMDKEEVAAAAGYTVNGHFNNVLGSLRTLGVITKRGLIGATELLYPASLV